MAPKVVATAISNTVWDVARLEIQGKESLIQTYKRTSSIKVAPCACVRIKISK